MRKVDEPHVENQYLIEHVSLLLSSFYRVTGEHLIPVGDGVVDEMNGGIVTAETARSIFHAPFALVSHGTELDPIFNYGNKTALNVFELSWGEFTALPSRQSAEPMNRDERAKLLEAVTQHGFINDYRGIRISSNGKRFWIENAIVWNLIDENGLYRGQAAVFHQWTYL